MRQTTISIRPSRRHCTTVVRRLRCTSHDLPPASTSTSIYPSLLLLLLLCCHFPILLVADTSNNNPSSSCPQQYSLTIPEAAIKKHRNRDKLIIAHRGASFHLPEHTLAAYRLALELGADFVEPDLVATQDGYLIAMHTADLNVTTNVVQVYGQERQPWFSPFVNRSGYWSFNFTLQEIQKLKVRQRLPRARTTAYDGMFGVPTLTEIQQLVNEWNQQRIPQLQLHVQDDDSHDDKTTTNNSSPNTTSLPQHEHYQESAGIYAELKASPWFASDANISLVDLFLQTITNHANNDQNTKSIFDPILSCPPLFKFDEYKVPPLVLQSFEGYVLQEMTEKWTAHPITQSAPLPPMILLVNKKDCWEEPKWFEIGETWRKYVQGLGMDKTCFPNPKASTSSYTAEELEQAQVVKDRAEEFNLVIHPYTERPEHEFLMEGFANALEETQYLFCTVGAQGVFSESVSTAVMAAKMECPEEDSSEGGGKGDDKGKDSGAASAAATSHKEESASPSGNDNDQEDKSKQSSSDLCWEDTSEANLYLGLASFVLGVFVTAMVSVWVNRSAAATAGWNSMVACCTRRPLREQRVPVEESSQGSIEEVPDDELL